MLNKSLWSWKQWSVSIPLTAAEAMAAYRWKQTEEFESDWLCGKPVGQIRQAADRTDP